MILSETDEKEIEMEGQRPWPASVRSIITLKKEKFVVESDSPAESPVAHPVLFSRQ